MRKYKKKELYPNTKKLSSSQVLDYAKSPRDFYTRWVAGLEKPPSKAMIFGLAFSDAYADRDWDYVSYLRKHKINKRWIELMTEALPLFPPLPKKNCEYEVVASYRGWKFRVTLDGYLPEQGYVIENKTGQLMWTQEVVDASDQLTIQAWAVWKKTGKAPKKILLNWLDTSTQATKLIHSFKTKRSVAVLRAFERSFLDVVLENLEANNFSNPVNVWQ